MAWDEEDELDLRNNDPHTDNDHDESLRGWLARAGVPGYSQSSMPMWYRAPSRGFFSGTQAQPSANGAQPGSPRSPASWGGTPGSPRSPASLSGTQRRYWNPAPAPSDAIDAAQREVGRYRVPLDISGPQFKPGVRGRLLGALAGAAAGAAGRDPIAAGDQAAHRKYFRAEVQRQQNLESAQQRWQNLAKSHPVENTPVENRNAEGNDPAPVANRPVWNFDGVKPAAPPPPPNPPGSSAAPAAASPKTALPRDQATIRTRSGKQVGIGDAVNVGGRTMYVTGFNRQTGKPTVSPLRPR